MPNFFSLDELKTFQSLENQRLTTVHYFVWLKNEASAARPDFLFFLELIFENYGSLLLTSGEDSRAIQLSTAADLVEIATDLQRLNSHPTIQKIDATRQPIWAEAIASGPLEAVRLTKNEADEYLNDALVFDFGVAQILVELSQKDGLEISRFQ